MSTGCPFCDLASGFDAPITGQNEIVFRDEDVVAFVGSHGFGLRPGHLIVIPLLHVATVMDAEADTLATVFGAAAKMARRLEEVLKCPGVTIRQNNGRAGDQEIDHLHVHVFPRWEGDRLYSEPRRLLDRDERLRLATELRL